MSIALASEKAEPAGKINQIGRFSHKLTYLMDNWDDADVQFNISLGNYDQMDKYVD
jgi:hypothetical protein